MLTPPHRHFWFTAFILSGIVLAIVLLGQTIWTYVFVSRDLVRGEARRQAAHDVTALEPAIFTGRVRDLEPLSEVLNELQRDASTRIAWVNVIGINGKAAHPEATNHSRALSTPPDGDFHGYSRKSSRARVSAMGDIGEIPSAVRCPLPTTRSRANITFGCQAACHLGNAVSKTVNLTKQGTVDHVITAFRTAFELAPWRLLTTQPRVARTDGGERVHAVLVLEPGDVHADGGRPLRLAAAADGQSRS
jgi:hypothetical protein